MLENRARLTPEGRETNGVSLVVALESSLEALLAWVLGDPSSGRTDLEMGWGSRGGWTSWGTELEGGSHTGEEPRRSGEGPLENQAVDSQSEALRGWARGTSEEVTVPWARVEGPRSVRGCSIDTGAPGRPCLRGGGLALTPE